MAQVSLRPPNNSRLIRRLLLMVACGFAFAFALVPIYDVLCRATGLNGRTAGGFAAGGLSSSVAMPAQPRPAVDLNRLVRVEFTGTVMPGLPWDMRPLQTSVELHPGEMQQVSYLVRNLSDKTVTAQAVPSVSPGQAAQHFEKIECFCFQHQTLAPGEAREMPLAFIIKPEINANIAQITLSYAFFSIDDQRQTLTSQREEK
ncbi:MAG: cytochrome c oxidase assembly protein [Betaproteobacteria bacterium]|nr:cytochrome c oxidase assembly protein [Betaproteobacteria bacterium]